MDGVVIIDVLMGSAVTWMLPVIGRASSFSPVAKCSMPTLRICGAPVRHSVTLADGDLILYACRITTSAAPRRIRVSVNISASTTACKWSMAKHRLTSRTRIVSCHWRLLAGRKWPVLRPRYCQKLFLGIFAVLRVLTPVKVPHAPSHRELLLASGQEPQSSPTTSAVAITCRCPQRPGPKGSNSVG